MVKDGVYEVNLSSLMEDESVIVSDEEGKYLIDINFLLNIGNSVSCIGNSPRQIISNTGNLVLFSTFH